LGEDQRQVLSDYAGKASFVVWLFAQSPQLYENYRNSSCDGLSFVFLLQWTAGDATNLIGCLLTHQLPFQIAVATYFCSVDVCILGQYYYYWLRNRRMAQQSRSKLRRRGLIRYASTTAPNMRSSSIQAPMTRAERNSSTSPSASFHRDTSNTKTRTRPPLHYYSYSNDSNRSYRALGQTAINVADLASQFAKKVAARDASRQEKWEHSKGRRAQRTKGKAMKRDNTSSESDGEGGFPTKMMDSILSDSSRSSEEYGYGFGTASTTLDKRVWPKEKMLSPSSPSQDNRGRDMRRTAGKIHSFSSSRSPNEAGRKTGVPMNSSSTQQQNAATLIVTPFDSDRDIIVDESSLQRIRPTHSRSSTTRSKTSSRSRGAGIVLLGLTALFGLQRNSTHSASTVSHVPMYHQTPIAYTVPQWDNISTEHSIKETAMTSRSTTPIYIPYVPHQEWHHSHERPPPPTWERIVGRLSAWTCTVLYMTSRLPQIWTNLSRKSVQGLSILLFISAALGNALYSASVLINPLASGNTRHEYLLESLPFLLGSGGTLIFDAIIVIQWLAWRGNGATVEVNHGISTSTFTYRGSSQSSRNTADVERHRWATSIERQPLLE
jgi:uncharacterized protein with PQ loop repeat